MPTPPISTEERARRKEVIEQCLRDGFSPFRHPVSGAKGGCVAEASRRLGVSRGAINDFIRREERAKQAGEPNYAPDWSLFAPPERTTPDAPDLQSKIAEQALKDEIARLRAENRALARASIEQDAILSIIGVMAKAETAPPAWLSETSTRSSGSLAEAPVAIWSDWHYGERVDPAAVNGYNEFNAEVAEQRIRRLVENTIHLCEHHGPGEYPGIVINLLGDFISGGLHPDLAKTDEYARIPSALRVRDLLLWALTKMADHFGRVFVPCTSGNHGRDTPKPEYKGYLHHNFDWLIYQLLQRHFEGDPRITFMIDPSNEAYYSVYGVRILAMHGDMLGVKGGDGIIGAIGPIMRGEIKTRGQSTSLGRPYDLLLGAHWHQELWLPRAIINNALKGFDEYAKNSLRAVPSQPSQVLFFIHPKRGITSRWSVLVEEPKVEERTDWVALPSSVG